MINLEIFKKTINTTALFLIVLFAFLIIARPDLCRNGAFNGIIICGRIIIPNLYPFTVCVLFIINSGVISFGNGKSKLMQAVFGINMEQAAIMLLSFVGGYPVGAKIIDRYVGEKRLSKKQGRVMLNYCVNGGPAFIIGAVGVGIFENRELGYILFFSHITASIIICIICRIFGIESVNSNNIKKSFSIIDNFVISAADAAATVLNISAFVVLFSAINEYIDEFSRYTYALKLLGFVSEVTNGVSKTDNVLLISFLLGFSGICVWFQVISSLKNFKPKIISFVLFRTFHGISSVVITLVLLKIFRISIETFTPNGFDYKLLYSTPMLAASMIMMCLLFMISLNRKKYSGNLFEDVVSL